MSWVLWFFFIEDRGGILGNLGRFFENGDFSLGEAVLLPREAVVDFLGKKAVRLELAVVEGSFWVD